MRVTRDQPFPRSERLERATRRSSSFFFYFRERENVREFFPFHSPLKEQGKNDRLIAGYSERGNGNRIQ